MQQLPIGAAKSKASKTRKRESTDVAFVKRVVFLGTSSALLFDCGEATQHQLMRLKGLGAGQIDQVFLTHLHGDHCFGIFARPGRNAEAAADDRRFDGYWNAFRNASIKCFCGVRKMASDFSHVCIHEFPSYKLEEGEEGGDVKRANSPNQEGDSKASGHRQCLVEPIDCGGGIQVIPRRIKHVKELETWGYIVQEASHPGKLDASKAMKLGARGKQLGALKAGLDVLDEDGKVMIRAADVVASPTEGAKVSLMWDTFDATNAKEASMGCMLLVHESTFRSSEKEKARQWGHSTAALTLIFEFEGMAGRFAAEVKAKALVLTHISSRYSSEEELQGLVDEAREAALSTGKEKEFNVRIASDFLELHRKKPADCFEVA
eukprot:jgi/Bigna1/77882/fgenesh1_pg.51_\